MSYAENLKIAVYATTERTKTVQIGNLIKAYGHENVGILSCEHGLTSIASLVDEKYIRVCDTLDDVRDAHLWARETFTRPDQWICVDGGSRVLQWIEQEVWSNVEAAYSASLNGQVPKHLQEWQSFVTKRDGINTQRVWSKVGSNAERLFNAFVRLPCSAYWTFWEQLTNIDQYTKGPPWTIHTPGGLTRDAVKGTFDFIFRLTRDDENEPIAICADSPKQYAKSRADWNAGIKVPAEWKKFDLAEFVKYVRTGER